MWWSMDCHALELLHYWTHDCIMFRRWGCFEQVKLLRWDDLLHSVQESSGIIVCPKIEIQGVYLVQIFLFVLQIEGRKMPLRTINKTWRSSSRVRHIHCY